MKPCMAAICPTLPLLSPAAAPGDAAHAARDLRAACWPNDCCTMALPCPAAASADRPEAASAGRDACLICLRPARSRWLPLVPASSGCLRLSCCSSCKAGAACLHRRHGFPRRQVWVSDDRPHAVLIGLCLLKPEGLHLRLGVCRQRLVNKRGADGEPQLQVCSAADAAWE